MKEPPGAGGTYVTSCAMIALVLSRRKVAVSPNSHKVIDDLLVAVAALVAIITQSERRTSIFPMLSPENSLRKAFGAASIPSSTV